MPRAPLSLLTAAACIAGAINGCQAPQSTQVMQPAPPAAAAAPSDAAAPAETAADATGTEGSADPAAAPASSADLVARQAEQHAAAIEALLNARTTEDARARGVKIVDASQPQPIVTATAAPAETAPAQAAPVQAAPASAAPTAQRTQLAAASPAQQPGLPPEVQFDSAGQEAAAISTPLKAPTTEPQAEEAPISAAAAEPVQLPADAQVRTAPAAPVDRGDTAAPRGGVSGSLELALARRAREYPRDLASQLDHQLLLFLKDETVPQAQVLGSLAAEDRDVLTALLDGLSNFRNAVRDDSNMLMNRKIRPLVEMSERLRARADLALPAAVLCKEVRGYGLYTPIEPARFEAGVTHPAIVYCEVDNFSSQINDQQLWETKLEQEIVLYTETGLPVWNDKKTQYTDASRNRRRDFFVNKIVTLPANLTFGRYVLKVTMTDVHANRVAETSIPITVVAK